MNKPWLPSALQLALGSCLALGAPLAQVAPAAASTLIALDLPAMVEQSDLIVLANAHSQASRYADGAIVTDVTLKVITSLKGTARPGESLVVTHLGGSVGRVGLTVPGAARFKLGQSAVVFLRRAGKDLNVTGMSQGVLSITGAPGAEQVQANTGDATLMQRNADGQLVERAAAPQKRALAELLAEIEQLAGKR